MTNALSWLNDLAEWLGRWVPRLVLIEPTHRGVRFGPRGASTLVGPGLICYWPIAQALVQIPVTTQSVGLSTQVLPFDDGTGERMIPRVLLCSAAVQFRVSNVVAAATRALSLHALVDNRAQAAIARHHHEAGDIGRWAEAVCGDLAKELKPFGVAVERLDFTQRGVGVALKNVSDWNYSDATNGKRE